MAEDMEIDSGAEKVLKMKEKAACKKGRGLTLEHSLDKLGEFDRAPGRSCQPGAQRSVEGWILFVNGLHEEVEEDYLQDKLAEYGEVKNVHLNIDRRTGFLKGYALVEYGLYKEALAAKEALDGSVIFGQGISVNWCFVNGPKVNRRKSASKTSSSTALRF